MVYMAAGDGADLDAHAVADLREMERADVGPYVDVVVQIDRFWPSRPQRYHIEGKRARLVRSDVVADEPIRDAQLPQKDIASAKEAKMSDAATLANFMLWSREHYAADRYFLVLWGHAYGLGFGRDHGEPLTLPEIRAAIAAFRRGVPPEDADAGAPATNLPLGPKLDLLGANACAVSYVEAGCELAEHVQYLVASEIAVPFAGWPYDAILDRLSRGQDGSSLTASQLGALVADRYVSHFADARDRERVAMSVLDLSLAGQLKTHVSGLADAIETLVDCSDVHAARRRAQLRATFVSTAGGDVRPMLDLYDLARRLDALCKDLALLEPDANSAVQSATAGLGIAAGTIMSFVRREPPARPEPQGGTQVAALPAFVVARRSHPELADLHGVGIFAPFVTDERDLKRLALDAATPETGRDAYFKLAFAAQNRWPALVYDVLRTALPGDVVTGVERSGATTRAERVEVTQLLASVDAVFDVLDWRIAAITARVVEQLPSAAGAAGAAPGAALDGISLNLLGTLRLVQHAEVDKMFAATEAVKGARGSGASRSSWKAPSAATSAQATAIADHFLRLEDALAETEQAVQRTLTNGTFGLGPGLGRDKEGFLGRDKEGFLGRDKEGFLGRDKEGFLGRDKEGFLGRDKEGFLGRDKEGFLGRDKEGFLGLLTGALLAERVMQPTAADVVADLFGQVGDAMHGLERAAAEAETLAAKALLAPIGTPGLESLANVTLAKARVERAMNALTEASMVLRQTVRRVAAHPAYGIGPGPQGLTVDDRRELARAGGLNGRRLTLL